MGVAATKIRPVAGQLEEAEAEGWRAAAATAIRGEMRRRAAMGGSVSEAEAAAALIEALALWQKVAGARATASGPASTELAEAQPLAFATLSARTMRCPACGAGGKGRFILGLASGRVAALCGDLAYACATEEELHDTTALCGSCGHTAGAGAFLP